MKKLTFCSLILFFSYTPSNAVRVEDVAQEVTEITTPDGRHLPAIRRYSFPASQPLLESLLETIKDRAVVHIADAVISAGIGLAVEGLKYTISSITESDEERAAKTMLEANTAAKQAAAMLTVLKNLNNVESALKQQREHAEDSMDEQEIHALSLKITELQQNRTKILEAITEQYKIDQPSESSETPVLEQNLHRQIPISAAGWCSISAAGLIFVLAKCAEQCAKQCAEAPHSWALIVRP